MSFNKVVTYISPLLVLFFTACSPRMLPVSRSIPEFSVSPLETSQFLSTSPLVLSDYISQPVEFFTPALEISEEFTGEEKYLVRAKTEKLFDRREELLLDLGKISASSFSFPLSGARIISPYGTRRGRNHTGIDLKTHAGDTIRAAFDGIVRIAGRSKGYGNVVVIRHYNGLETVYGHNSRFLIKAGDKITAGTPISLEGRTGRATTDHLHFETRINGQPFDPNLIIDFTTQKLHNRCIVFTPDANGKIRIDQV